MCQVDSVSSHSLPSPLFSYIPPPISDLLNREAFCHFTSAHPISTYQGKVLEDPLDWGSSGFPLLAFCILLCLPCSGKYKSWSCSQLLATCQVTGIGDAYSRPLVTHFWLSSCCKWQLITRNEPQSFIASYRVQDFHLYTPLAWLKTNFKVSVCLSNWTIFWLSKFLCTLVVPWGKYPW